MLPRRTIAVDLCNTVCDINGVLEKCLHTTRKKGSYHIDGLTPEFFQVHTEIFREAEPFPYAADALRLLNEEYDIVYLTARPEVAYNATLDFLRNNHFPAGEIIFSTRKADVFLQKKTMAFAIDDAPHEIASYVSAGIPVLIKAWDYNEHMGPRFEWNALYEWLQMYYSRAEYRMPQVYCSAFMM